ncbi:MAG: hypothetical protein FI692_07785 [SAR202 cluster bacterium]|nr:hypothetical protein [SAR202 cluster bacterium]|tara:strand:+ start:984 stop:1463 length:480 start_codon:yes stop_codon:yes gene_type:complete
MVQEGKGTGRKRGRPRKNPEATQQVKDQEGSEDMVQETETIVEDFPVGTDSGSLFASEETKTLEIIFKGQKWVFTYKDLNWGDKNACVDQAQEWDNGEFKFSVNKYYVKALSLMLVDTPIRPITETTLAKLDRRIGEQLISIVPNPVETSQETEEIKKE